ncbi:MAG: LamG domain-containing protein [Deltaproteobacteria bacterium]|nr:LamG domain-containing protein [Candidatus Tharpella sp.]
MKCRKPATDNRGFSLLLVLIMMTAVTIGLVMLTRSAFKGEDSSKNEVTVARMNVVAKALRQYYLGHRDLPAPDANSRVPVVRLSLQSKYGLDGWGKFIHYNYDSASDLRGISVDGKAVAAVLVSSGSNQEIEAATRPGNGTIYLEVGNDDILMPVTLQSEAVALATTILHSLARKTCSYICVNGESVLDDDDLDATDAMGALDGDGFTGGLSQVGLLLEFSLNTAFYAHDPWGNSYQWLGDSSSPANSFRSLGPDSVVSGDDIIVGARTTLMACGCSVPPPLSQFTFEANQIQGNIITVKTPYGESIGTLEGDTSVVAYQTGADYDGPPSSSAGEYAVYFDGNHDYIIMDQPSYFALDEDFTLSAWFKTTGVLNPYAKVISRRIGSYKYYFLGSKGNSGTANCDSGGVAHPYGGVLGGQDDYNLGGHQTTTRTIISMPCGEWHHVAVVFDHELIGSSLSIYYDGLLQETRSGLPVSAPDDEDIKLTIGADSGGGSGFFQGWIDNAALFDEALTGEQIITVMDKSE